MICAASDSTFSHAGRVLVQFLPAKILERSHGCTSPAQAENPAPDIGGKHE